MAKHVIRVLLSVKQVLNLIVEIPNFVLYK